MADLLKNRVDADQLLNLLLEHAKDLLVKYGEFFPFGASIQTDGEPVMNAAYEGEHPPSKNLIDSLYKHFQSTPNIRAIGICADVKITDSAGESSDAIQVSIETASGDSVDVLLTYRKIADGYDFGELSVQGKQSVIF